MDFAEFDWFFQVYIDLYLPYQGKERKRLVYTYPNSKITIFPFVNFSEFFWWCITTWTIVIFIIRINIFLLHSYQTQNFKINDLILIILYPN